MIFGGLKVNFIYTLLEARVQFKANLIASFFFINCKKTSYRSFRVDL
jgi:hypothetical protein